MDPTVPSPEPLETTKAVRQLEAARNGGRFTCYFIRVFLLTLLGAFLSGLVTAIPGGVFNMGPFLKKFFPQIPDGQGKNSKYCMFNSELLALYGISNFVTGAVGNLLAASVLTRIFGPRVSMFWGAVCYVVGACLQIAAPGQYMLLIGRLVQGLGFGFINQAVPLYLAEISPKGRPGALVCAVQLSTKTGALLTNIVNYFLMQSKEGNLGWIMSLSLILIPSACALCIASKCFLLETPLRLIQTRNDTPGAERLLQCMRGTDDVKEELNSTTIRACTESGTLLPRKRYISALITAGILIPISIQLTGVNMLGPIIFRALGFSQRAALLVDIVNCFASLVSTIVVIPFVDKTRRKNWLILGDAFMSISLIVLYVIEVIGLHCAYLCTAMVSIHAVGFGISWGPLGVLIITEIYPSEIRSLGLGISGTMNNISSALIGQFYLQVLCSLGHWIFLVLAGMVTLITTLYVPKYLPETGGIPMANDEESVTGPSTPLSTTPSQSDVIRSSSETSYASS